MYRLFTQNLFVLLGLVFATTSMADVFEINDSDFVNGVYEFRYYSQSNTAYVNGNQVMIASLFLTNDGVAGPIAEGGVKYWEASGHFGAQQLAGHITMGWDLSAVSLGIGKAEILSNAAIFQFDPSAPHAFEDKIFGEVATPTSFGGSPYSRYFEYEGDNDGSIGALSNSGLVQDVTSNLASSWLNSPDLFELKLGYQQHAIDGSHPNIPGKHIQFFRDNAGTGNDSFLLRFTSVPEPNSVAICVLGLIGVASRRRRRAG